MGVMSAARALTTGGMANLRISGMIIKEVNTLVKAKPREEVSQALLSDDAMRVFAQGLYDRLSAPLKQQVKFEGFLDLVLKNRATLMSKPRNQKKALKK